MCKVLRPANLTQVSLVFLSLQENAEIVSGSKLLLHAFHVVFQTNLNKIYHITLNNINFFPNYEFSALNRQSKLRGSYFMLLLLTILTSPFPWHSHRKDDQFYCHIHVLPSVSHTAPMPHFFLPSVLRLLLYETVRQKQYTLSTIYNVSC
jgi:hypothetical protein